MNLLRSITVIGVSTPLTMIMIRAVNANDTSTAVLAVIALLSFMGYITVKGIQTERMIKSFYE